MAKRADGLDAFTLESKKGETVAQLHVRKASILRRARFWFFMQDWNLDNNANCEICHFGRKIYINIHIEGTHGKVHGYICENCAKAIIDGLESQIDRRLTQGIQEP